jgi:hypothetical protein
MMTKELDELMLKVLVFTDRHGRVVSKDGNPVYTRLAMTYDSDDLHIDMHAQASAQGNGSCSARVKWKEQLVFDAGGCYITGPFHVKAKVFKPGRWQALVTEKGSP